jgi:glycosyl transferase family WbsX
MDARTPKLIAFYLPQFHPIQENSAWWGEGFTDWVNVKNSKPLFQGHRQPREPGNSLGYYDPTDIQVLEKQAELAKAHGIYGFCFYHYWFNGRLLLERPVENFLDQAKPDMPFCLCWANEPWTKAWDGREQDVLMPQRYGGQEDWTAHFNYLLPAFKDSRAITVEGKPVFLIYRVGSITNVNEMIKTWRQLAVEAGLPGLHIVTMLTSFADSSNIKNVDIDATCEFFPTNAFRPKRLDLLWGGFKMGLHLRVLKRFTPFVKNRVIRVDYDYIWKRILKTKKIFSPQYRGAFTAWDNSPRKGKKGVIMHNATPDRYQYWLTKQIERVLADDTQDPLLFVNAWNEWAEGAYMEPDKTFDHGFLEATRKAVQYDSHSDDT